MLFGRKPKQDPAAASRDLRQQALTVAPAEFSFAPTAELPHVWGALMEMGFPQAAVTLVVMADGTTSLYYSSGGGVIGAGMHDAVRVAAHRFLLSVESDRAAFTPVTETPLPAAGQARFYVRTFDGLLGADAPLQDLHGGDHPLSDVFRAGDAVLTELRLLDQRKPR